jgi:uncharacterized membrane protein YdjX (TVP38/TMEM64 family)
MTKFLNSIDKNLAYIFGVIVAVGIAWVMVLGIRAISGSTVVAFPPALQSWTTWVGSVAGIIVSAKVLWVTAAALHKYAKLP